jgi:hypothetical protein
MALGLAALVFCVGIAIGLRYSLAALVPAVFGILCLHVLDADASSLHRVGSAIFHTMTIQGGYMVGLTAREPVRAALSRLSAVLRST